MPYPACIIEFHISLYVLASGETFSKSIHLFDNIIDSTLSLNKVARFTKMLALYTSVLGGSLKEEAGIKNVVYERQELVKVCEETSSHIEEVVVSTRKNLKEIIDINKQHLGKKFRQYGNG